MDRVGVWQWLAPPPRTFPYAGAGGLLLLLAHPLLLTGILEGPLDERLAATSDMSLLLQNIAVFAAAVVLAFDWRFNHSVATGWLSAAFAFVSVQNLPFSLLAVAGSSYGGFGKVNGFTSLPVLLAALLMVGLAALGRRGPLPNPLLVGVPLGILVGTVRLTLVAGESDPSLRLGGGGEAALVAAVFVVTALNVVALACVRELQPWARSRLMLGFALVTASVSFPTEAGYEPASVVRVCLGMVAATLLAATAVAVARSTFRTNGRRLVTLAHRAATAEAALRHDEERRHELNATIAGVAQASRVLLQEGGPTGARRARLQRMLDNEMARLERMLAERKQERPIRLTVDDVIRPLVTVQRTLGHDVAWEPSGLHGVGRADDLSEVVHILLTNAVRHAPGSRAEVTTRLVGRTIEITVADEGPGIDPGVRRDLFTWGARRPGSPGSGIGLQLGRRLMIDQGGDLRLAETERHTGAVFVVTLPAAQS